MSKRANPTVVGAFVVGALALAVAGVLVFGGYQFTRRPPTAVMFFDGSVAGLTVGSPVLARGVPMGTVSDIQLRHGQQRIAVFARLDREQAMGGPRLTSRQELEDRIKGLVGEGLRAQLRSQSLITGQLYVALDFFPDAPATFTGLEPSLPEVPTVPSQLEQFADQVKRVAARLEKLPLEQLVARAMTTIEGIDQLARSPELTDTLGAVRSALADAQALARTVQAQVGPLAASARRTLDEAGALTADARTAASTLESTSEAARALVHDARSLVQNLDGQVGPLVESITSTADAARAALESAQTTLAGAQGTLTSVSGALEQDSPLGDRLARALDEINGAARALRSLAGSLERQPNTLLFGKRRPRGP